MGSLPGNRYDGYMLPKAIEQVTIWLSGQKLRQNWLKSSLSNALNAVLCGAGYNLQIDPANHSVFLRLDAVLLDYQD